MIGLDPATVCGWRTAHGHGTWTLKFSGETIGQMLNRLERELFAKNEDDELQWIAYEEATFGALLNTRGQKSGAVGQIQTAMFHAQVRGMMMAVAAKLGIDTYGYVSTAMKKFATGDGRATKEQVKLAVERTMGLSCIDDNDSDACVVYEMALQGIEPTYLNGRSVAAKRKRSAKRKRKTEPKLF